MVYKRKEDRNRYMREWRKKNPDKEAKSKAKYKKNHPGAAQKSCRKWRAKHPDYGKLYYYDNKEEMNKAAIKWQKDNPDKVDVIQTRYRDNHREEINGKAKKNYVPSIRKNRYERDWHRQTERSTQRHQKIRSIAIWHYSGGTYRCACCGYNEGKVFLEIDHIDGNGSKHRKQIGHRRFAEWVLNNKLPKGYQILCCNCNRGKFRNGGICPHQQPDFIEPSVIPKRHAV